MDANLSSGNMVPSVSYGMLNLEGSLHVHHQQNPHSLLQQRNSHPIPLVQSSMHNILPLTVGNLHDCDQSQPLSAVDYNKPDRGKPSTSDEDEPSFTEDGVNGHNEVGAKGKKSSPWHRMKWTDSMVRLLITVVSYLGEDALSGARKVANLQKKGKWKLVSKVMAERGCYVSPQQCEDKFNDLNKRYKRLTDLLGRGTSCKVVENPALLDLMNHLSEKAKEEVRKILSSKQLFYEEMCSYHNGNRLFLPADLELQRSLQLALRSRDELDAKGVTQDDMDEDDPETETYSKDEGLEENNHAGLSMFSSFPKRIKLTQDSEEPQSFGNPSSFQQCSKRPYHQIVPTDMNYVFPEGAKATASQGHWMKSRAIHLEEQKLQIEEQMLEMEKQRLKWRRISRKKDKELNKLRMENERMRLENDRLALELKRIELDFGFK